MRLIDADRALEIVRDQGIAHPNAHHLTRYATLILQEAPTITDLSKCVAFNSTVDGKPLTNADRVRVMSDEELAAWAINEAPKIGFRYTSSETGLLKWLKQPAEEDD